MIFPSHNINMILWNQEGLICIYKMSLASHYIHTWCVSEQEKNRSSLWVEQINQNGYDLFEFFFDFSFIFLLLLYFPVDFLMLTDLCSKIRFTHIDFRKSSKKILKLHKWYDGVEKKKSMWSILPNLNSLELKKGLHTTIIMNTKSISFTVEFFLVFQLMLILFFFFFYFGKYNNTGMEKVVN